MSSHQRCHISATTTHDREPSLPRHIFHVLGAHAASTLIPPQVIVPAAVEIHRTTYSCCAQVSIVTRTINKSRFRFFLVSCLVYFFYFCLSCFFFFSYVLLLCLTLYSCFVSLLVMCALLFWLTNFVCFFILLLVFITLSRKL